MNVLELARELGVRAALVLEELGNTGFPLTQWKANYQLTDEQVRQITARIGVAP